MSLRSPWFPSNPHLCYERKGEQELRGWKNRSLPTKHRHSLCRPLFPTSLQPCPLVVGVLKMLANLRRSIQTLCLRFCDLLYITYEASRRSSGRVPETLGTRCL